jgi:adenylate cyclase
VRVLSSNPSLTDSDDRSEVDGAIVLFKAALHELPQADSLYVGHDNGCWLQVRRLDVLDPTERQRLGAPPRGRLQCQFGPPDLRRSPTDAADLRRRAGQ